MTDQYTVTADQLRAYVERVEALEAEKKDISEQIKETYSEAKGTGYDTAALKAIVAMRRKDKDDLAEQEAIVELYKSALGMS